MTRTIARRSEKGHDNEIPTPVDRNNVDRMKRDLARLMLKWAARKHTPDEAQAALQEMADTTHQLYQDAEAAARFNKLAGKGGGRTRRQLLEDEEDVD